MSEQKVVDDPDIQEPAQEPVKTGLHRVVSDPIDRKEYEEMRRERAHAILSGGTEDTDDGSGDMPDTDPTGQGSEDPDPDVQEEGKGDSEEVLFTEDEGKITVYGIEYESPEEAADALKKKEEGLKELEARTTRERQQLVEQRKSARSVSPEAPSVLENIRADPALNAKFNEILEGLYGSEDVTGLTVMPPDGNTEINDLRNEVMSLRQSEARREYANSHGLSREEGIRIFNKSLELSDAVREETGRDVVIPMSIAHRIMVADLMPKVIAQARKSGIEEGRKLERARRSAGTAGKGVSNASVSSSDGKHITEMTELERRKFMIGRVREELRKKKG